MRPVLVRVRSLTCSLLISSSITASSSVTSALSYLVTPRSPSSPSYACGASDRVEASASATKKVVVDQSELVYNTSSEGFALIPDASSIPDVF